MALWPEIDYPGQRQRHIKSTNSSVDYSTGKKFFWYFQPSKPVKYYCHHDCVLVYLPFFNLHSSKLCTVPPPSIAFTSSFPKKPNPSSPSPSQTKNLLGFIPSQSFSTPNLRFSTTHQHFSTRTSFKR